MSLEKIIKAIKENSKFLITSHINLEADALGSELAMAELLKDEKKQVVIVNEDKVPREYLFLPGRRKIKQPKGNFDFDVFVVLDCSDLNRCGKVKDLITKGKLILNIDHHRANKRFGQINWLEPDSSSCCEMIYKLYKELNKPIKRDVAVLLYTGILTDTGSFRYPNTTKFTHRAISELLQFKLPISDIYYRIYESIPYSDVKLISQILFSLEKDISGEIFYLVMNREILKKKRSHYDLTENVLNFARSIRGAKLIILFKEIHPKEIRVNLRSKEGFDVARLARFFGGGGHRTAAGCTINKELEVAKNLVLKKARELLR